MDELNDLEKRLEICRKEVEKDIGDLSQYPKEYVEILALLRHSEYEATQLIASALKTCQMFRGVSFLSLTSFCDLQRLYKTTHDQYQWAVRIAKENVDALDWFELAKELNALIGRFKTVFIELRLEMAEAIQSTVLEKGIHEALYGTSIDISE